MVKVKEDMTGWIMAEHGFPESRITVVGQDEDYISPSGKHYAKWICECSCEDHNVISVLGKHLRKGSILSCGCLGKENRIKSRTTHGKSSTRLYGVWQNIKSRCYNPSNEFYDCYGGRGITMCSDWKDNFESFYNWAMLNGYDENAEFADCTIDRIDVDSSYCPENCRWTNKFCQAMNHRTQKNNTSGVRGVKWDSVKQKWYSQIDIMNNRIFLGRFNNKNDAIIARLNAEQKYLGKSAPQIHLFKQYNIKDEN